MLEALEIGAGIHEDTGQTVKGNGFWFGNPSDIDIIEIDLPLLD